MRKILLLICTLSLWGAAHATASIVVTFEDGDPYYADFNWDGFSPPEGSDENKYVTAIGTATITRKDNLAFTFEGAAFAVSEGGITVEGYLGDSFVDSINITPEQEFKFFPANISGVDRLVFTSESNTTWRMDNFHDLVVLVPEPATYIAGALFLLPFAASTLSRLRKEK